MLSGCALWPGPGSSGPELEPEPGREAGEAPESSTAKGSNPVTPLRLEPDAGGRATLLQGGRVLTADGGVYDRADVYFVGRRIEAVGVDLPVPEGAEVIDVSGRTVTPGLIDTHSHLGVYAAPGFVAHADGNEMVKPVTAYADAADAYWPQDPQIDLARAGGVTTAQILPGSGNLIGGRSVVVKFRPGPRSAREARFEAAPAGLKMACGENPKRVYGKKGGPMTRMGNVAGYRKAFQQAVEYRSKWEKHWRDLARFEKKREERTAEALKGSGGEKTDDEKSAPPTAPPVDHGLETLVGVLNGEILVHNHCYRADEMSRMLDLAESFGFRIRSFHHAVEAYKIADRLAATGTAASMWADWWGFKAEAYDGVRENAAMVSRAGGRAIIHSDSPVGIQHLNQEAAKAMFAGRRAGFDVSEEEALRWITSNAAWALGIDAVTGSLSQGKYADIVVWDRDPFSVYARTERVYIDGELVYDRDDPARQPRTDFGIGLRPGDIGGAR